MNKLKVFLGIILVVVSAGFLYYMLTLPQEPANTVFEDERFVFVNQADEELTVQYDESAEVALVTFADNSYELQRAVSGSGTRYQSDNELVVLTEHQAEVRLTIDGQEVMVGTLAPQDADIQVLEERSIEPVSDLIESVEVVDIPVLGQRCVDSATVDCAALQAASASAISR